MTQAKKIGEVSDTDKVLFRKKIKQLESYQGKGTELISVYVPENADRSSVMNQLNEEISQSSNIKSQTTRKNVQGALRKITHYLKVIDFKIPKRGIVVFAGNISAREGQNDIRLFTINPVQDLKVKLYWCDSKFHLEPLKDMMISDEVYGLATIDKRESLIAVLNGKTYQILRKMHSGVPGKIKAGGQSAVRFNRLREEAELEFYKRISESMNQIFVPMLESLKGIIIGGPGGTKHDFMEKDLIDYRLKTKILAMLDIGYTDESGIRELFQKSEVILKDTSLMRERNLVSKFMESIVTTGLATYGEKEVMKALEMRQVDLILVSEGLEWTVVKIECNSCGKIIERVIKDTRNYDATKEKCDCGSSTELLEEIDYVDYLIEKGEPTGCEIKVISTETPEGKQFLEAFGGLGAMLRYK